MASTFPCHALILIIASSLLQMVSLLENMPKYRLRSNRVEAILPIIQLQVNINVVLVRTPAHSLLTWDVASPNCPGCLRGCTPWKAGRFWNILYQIRAIWWILLGKIRVIINVYILLKQCLSPLFLSFPSFSFSLFSFFFLFSSSFSFFFHFPFFFLHFFSSIPSFSFPYLLLSLPDFFSPSQFLVSGGSLPLPPSPISHARVPCSSTPWWKTWVPVSRTTQSNERRGPVELSV